MLLQIIPIVFRSPVPFCGPSIAFTDHFYRLQITCTFLRTIYSFWTDHSYRLQIICTFLRTTIALQIIPILSRAPVPFYGPSIAFTDHSYRLQVTCIFLRTIHSFHTSFLSSPGQLYLFANHLIHLQIIPIISKSSVPFYGQPYLLQIIPIVSRSSVPFYGPSIAFTDHSYCL